MFFILCDDCKTFFLIQVYLYSEVFLSQHYVDVFETSVLKEVRILDYLKNDSAMPKSDIQS